MILLIIQYRIISCKPIEINSLPGNALARMDAAGAPFAPTDFEAVT